MVGPLGRSYIGSGPRWRRTYIVLEIAFVIAPRSGHTAPNCPVDAHSMYGESNWYPLDGVGPRGGFVWSRKPGYCSLYHTKGSDIVADPAETGGLKGPQHLATRDPHPSRSAADRAASWASPVGIAGSFARITGSAGELLLQFPRIVEIPPPIVCAARRRIAWVGAYFLDYTPGNPPPLNPGVPGSGALARC